MRFARATLTAAMATSLLITTTAASSTNVHLDDHTELQQELHHLAYLIKEISKEDSWSSDTLPSNDVSSNGGGGDGNSFTSMDEESVKQWMEWKEVEVQSYYTLLSGDDGSDDDERRRSSMAASQHHDDDNGSDEHTNNSGQFEHRLNNGRRHLRTVPSPTSTTGAEEERKASTTDDADQEVQRRELGKGVGMKRSDPRAAAGRFTPSEERTPPRGRRDPPKGRERDSSSNDNKVGGGGSGAASASAGPGSLKRGPQEGVTKESSSSSSSKPLRAETTTATSGGSRWSNTARDHSPKSMKEEPPPPRAQQVPPPPARAQQFPNAVYVQHPPPPQQRPQQQQQQQIVVVEEVEECYDVEELMAMGLLLNIQHAQQQVAYAPVYRKYDGTLLNNHQGPGGTRRSLQHYQYQYQQPQQPQYVQYQQQQPQQYHQQQPQQYTQYPYNYWAWDPESKSAKSPKGMTNTVYVSQPQTTTTTQMVYGVQQPPPPQTTTQTQMVYGGQQQQRPPPPMQTVYVGQQPPPPSTNTILYVNHQGSKSAKSKSGKMTKSGKLCSSPLPPPPPPPQPIAPSICGTSLLDASTNCAQTCHKDSDCPEVWDICIPNVIACTPRPGYCGLTLQDASKCTTQCWNDAGCPNGQSCFDAGTQVVACEIPTQFVGYCGSQMSANRPVDVGKCDAECNSDGDCPSGQSCYSKDVVDCIGDTTGYCGTSLADASKCAVECTSNADCPGGEGCYSASVVTCQADTGYCGSNLLDASKCAVECTSNADCPSGEGCYSSSVVTCADDVTGYCGSSLLDASKCDDVCTSDGDCPGGESCFVGSVECKPGFCGTDGDDATKCEVPCSSDVGCPVGEICFNDVECAPPCPTGCKDCDPDSPLPCPNPMMKQVCDKQNDTLYPPGNPRAGERISNFKDCFDMCRPSFCCIHASQSKVIAPTCAKEYDNCPLYYPCYIIWWKLHDTIGPAPYLRVEQKEPFFNVKLDQLQDIFDKEPEFKNQVFGHHFDDDDPLDDKEFENPEKW